MFSLIIIRLLTVLLLVTNGSANVEKTIFVAPSKQSIAGGRPTLGALRLQTLSPRVPAIRTHLEAVFTSKEHPRGLESWFLLDELLEGKRYEVRLCWMSTQPTAFDLMTFELATVFAEPPLIQSLAAHAEKRQTAQATDEDDESHRDTESGNEIIASTLFLRVAAAADYFTTNITLMNEVPPVYVDLILDAYIFNVFPQSLVPTGVYLLILAVGAWYLSRYIHAWLHSVAVPVDDHKKTS